MYTYCTGQTSVFPYSASYGNREEKKGISISMRIYAGLDRSEQVFSIILEVLVCLKVIT